MAGGLEEVVGLRDSASSVSPSSTELRLGLG